MLLSGCVTSRDILTARGPSELDADLSPLIRVPARVQHRAQEPVEADHGMPERGVGVRYGLFGSRGSTVSGKHLKSEGGSLP